jgi:hypothetical protein
VLTEYSANSSDKSALQTPKSTWLAKKEKKLGLETLILAEELV